MTIKQRAWNAAARLCRTLPERHKAAREIERAIVAALLEVAGDLEGNGCAAPLWMMRAAQIVREKATGAS